ncbi:hypothetical protein ACVWZ7_000425 [Arthrobacter sp. TE12232]
MAFGRDAVWSQLSELRFNRHGGALVVPSMDEPTALDDPGPWYELLPGK